MKLRKSRLFIIISSMALLTVLIIQVIWIFQAARMKEEMFNEKASQVLSETAKALSADRSAFSNLQVPSDSNEVHKIDSLFNHFMKIYNIHIDYYFEVIPSVASYDELTLMNYGSNVQPGCFTACVGNPSDKNVMELKLMFPKQKQYIIAEMRTPFISSVVLILIVLILSWRTMLSLAREKKISDHTSDYLNNMTHEFKTPLTNIALAGKMIQKMPAVQKEERVRHYSGIILEENEKLHHQVEQVLSMTALERGEIPLHKTALDFHEVIHDALKYISIQIESRNGKAELHLDAERAVIMGDQVNLTNAIRNLIDNAVKYSIDRPEITIQTSNTKGNVVMTISDKGIGIEKKFQKKVFKKYFRISTGAVHDVKGFGLGLSYVNEIVRLHNGSIKMKSKKGIGTTFTITLPNA